MFMIQTTCSWYSLVHHRHLVHDKYRQHIHDTHLFITYSMFMIQTTCSWYSLILYRQHVHDTQTTCSWYSLILYRQHVHDTQTTCSWYSLVQPRQLVLWLSLVQPRQLFFVKQHNIVMMQTIRHLKDKLFKHNYNKIDDLNKLYMILIGLWRSTADKHTLACLPLLYCDTKRMKK